MEIAFLKKTFDFYININKKNYQNKNILILFLI